MQFRRFFLGALLAVAMALFSVPTADAQIGQNVQNGFQTCSGANCSNDLTLGATDLVNGTTLKYATVSLTNAQVLAIDVTAVSIIAAPGAGSMIEVLGGMVIFDYTAAYTESADNLRLYYGDSGQEPASNVIEMTGFINATADSIIKFGPVANDQVVAGTELTNTAIVLSGTGGGDFGGGNASNVIKVVIAYRVIYTGL